MKNLILSVLCVVFLMACGHTNFPQNTNYVAVEPIIPVVSVEKFEVEEDCSKVRIAEAVMFDFDSAEIRMDQVALINKIAALMEEHPNTLLLLDGFASKEGAKDYNQKLSEKRVLAVYDALMERGVEDNRIIGMDAHGATDEFNEAELSPNRTVIVLSLEALMFLNTYDM